ncbi:MAG: valine--tRNA ligase, partial [Flavobacteriales bacterium]|nr:valine--tRNA ligase [Flavobacteriales bacterium]
LGDRSNPKDALVVAPWPTAGEIDELILSDFALMEEVVTGVRTIRKNNQLPQKQAITLMVRNNGDVNNRFDAVVKHLCNVEEIVAVSEKQDNAFSFLVKTSDFFVPFGENVDLEGEREKLTKELEYYRGFLISVDKKLSNEKFVSSAPAAVVDAEKKKQADAQMKIATITEKLSSLN